MLFELCMVAEILKSSWMIIGVSRLYEVVFKSYVNMSGCQRATLINGGFKNEKNTGKRGNNQST